MTPVPLTPEQEKARRSRTSRSRLSLVGFVALFFVMTLVRLGGAVGDRTF